MTLKLKLIFRGCSMQRSMMLPFQVRCRATRFACLSAIRSDEEELLRPLPDSDNA